MITFSSSTVVLVLIDLQNGIVGGQLAPRSGDEIIETASAVAERFSQKNAPWCLSVGHRTAATPYVSPSTNLDSDSRSKDWSDLVEDVLSKNRTEVSPAEALFRAKPIFKIYPGSSSE